MSRILKPSGTFDCHKLLDHILLYMGCDAEYIFNGGTASSGPGPPYNRGFTMTLKHTTHGRIPLDE